MKHPWAIIGTAAILSAAVLAYALAQDTTDQQYKVGLLASVRISSVYFLIAFTAGPLWRLTQAARFRLLLANRRYIGLCFALLHSVHLLFIGLWVNANPDKTDTVVLLGGGLAYSLMYLQALTSNQISVRLLKRYWRWLQTFAMYTLWLVLTFTFAGSDSLTAKVYTALLIAALGIRLLAAQYKRTT